MHNLVCFKSVISGKMCCGLNWIVDIFSRQGKQDFFFSGLDVVCERKTKDNYNIFWSGKMELPFIETGETVMEIDWWVECKLI